MALGGSGDADRGLRVSGNGDTGGQDRGSEEERGLGVSGRGSGCADRGSGHTDRGPEGAVRGVAGDLGASGGAGAGSSLGMQNQF